MSGPLRIAAVVLLAGVVWGLHTLWLAGAFRSVERRFAGRCVSIRGVPGPEDLTLHPTRPLAYVSGHDRAALAAGRPARGALWAYHFGDAEGREEPGRLVNLTPEASPDFRPHGLSLWAGADGELRLFVIDHAGGEHAVRIYEVTEDSVALVETLSDPLLRNPNDLVAVGPREFYVTNDHRWSEGWRNTVENWLRLPVSDVVHFKGGPDGGSFEVALRGLVFPNGIAASADGRELVVASLLGRELRVHSRDPATGVLTETDRVALGTAPDNIEPDGEGGFWVGAHPKLLAVSAYGAGSAPRAPSQVLHVLRAPDGWRVEEVYLDDGREISAASVAAVRDGRLLIGAIGGSHFLECQLP